tara:strand:- start:42 stop:1130 length:1089 start_codon:yes stop_codon:yes gene_type:complete
MHALGFTYVLLDDCWVNATRDNATGSDTITWDRTRFPSGMPHLASTLHKMNLSFGLYTSAGDTTCHGGPGSRGHYEQDAQTFASWGVDYVKLDWCGDIKKELALGAAAHVNFSRALRATARPMHLETVAGYFFLGPLIETVANSWRFCVDHADKWTSTTEQLLCRVDLALTLGAGTGHPGSWASMDYLHLGGAGCATAAHCPGQSEDEYRSSFAAWALTQSPLLVDTDIRGDALTPFMRELLLNNEIIELHQFTGTKPGGYIGRDSVCSGSAGSEEEACSIWGRKASVDGRVWMVALMNSGGEPHDIVFNVSALTSPLWTAVASFSVRDVWKREDVPGVHAGSVTMKGIPSHGAALITVALV